MALTILNTEQTKLGHVHALRCDCGKTFKLAASLLRNRKSCGCQTHEPFEQMADKIATMLSDGFSVAEVARRIDANFHNLARFIKARGWKPSPAARVRGKREVRQDIETALKAGGGFTIAELVKANEFNVAAEVLKEMADQRLAFLAPNERWYRVRRGVV